MKLIYTFPTLVCECVARRLCMCFALIYTAALAHAFSQTKVGNVYKKIFELGIIFFIISICYSPNSFSKKKDEINNKFHHSIKKTSVVNELACPLTASGDLKEGRKWNIESAKRAMNYCPSPTIKIVKRKWVGDWNRHCSMKETVLSTDKTWLSCPPPPVCSAFEQFIKRDKAKERLAAWKKKCSGEKVVIPEDDDPICFMPNENIQTIVVHHTETPQNFGPVAIQEIHHERLFDDIGYHFLIANTPTGWGIFEARSVEFEGAHVGAGLNSGSIGIAIAGDYNRKSRYGQFDRKEQFNSLLPPPKAMYLLLGLVHKLSQDYPIKKIYSHGQLKKLKSGCTTDCPGYGFNDLLVHFRPVFFRVAQN